MTSLSLRSEFSLSFRQNNYWEQTITTRSEGSARLMRKPDKSYKRECQETNLTVGSVPVLFCLGIQPNWLNVHSHSESGLAQV